MDAGLISCIIAGISLVASVSSAVVAPLVNNHYQSKSFEIEYYVKHRSEVIENYLKCCGAYLYCQGHAQAEKYGQALSEIYMYIPEKHWSEIDNLDEKISNIKSCLSSDSPFATRTALEQYRKILKLLAPFARHSKKYPKG